jgi:hypothetical protein
LRRTPVQRIHPPKPSQSRRRKPRVKSCQFILTDIRFLDYRISPYHKVFTNGWSLSYSRTNIIFRSDILLAHSVPLDVIAVLHPVSLRSRSIFVVYHHEPYSTRGLCPACHGFKLLRVGLGQSATICRYLPPGPPQKKKWLLWNWIISWTSQQSECCSRHSTLVNIISCHAKGTIWIIGQSFHFASMFWRSEVCPPHHGWPRLSFVQRPPMCRHRQHLQHQTVKVLHKELPPTTGRTHKTKLNPSLRTMTSHDNLGNEQSEDGNRNWIVQPATCLWIGWGCPHMACLKIWLAPDRVVTISSPPAHELIVVEKCWTEGPPPASFALAPCETSLHERKQSGPAKLRAEGLFSARVLEWLFRSTRILDGTSDSASPHTTAESKD